MKLAWKCSATSAGFILFWLHCSCWCANIVFITNEEHWKVGFCHNINLVLRFFATHSGIYIKPRMYARVSKFMLSFKKESKLYDVTDQTAGHKMVFSQLWNINFLNKWWTVLCHCVYIFSLSVPMGKGWYILKVFCFKQFAFSVLFDSLVIDWFSHQSLWLVHLWGGGGGGYGIAFNFTVIWCLATLPVITQSVLSCWMDVLCPTICNPSSS